MCTCMGASLQATRHVGRVQRTCVSSRRDSKCHTARPCLATTKSRSSAVRYEGGSLESMSEDSVRTAAKPSKPGWSKCTPQECVYEAIMWLAMRGHLHFGEVIRLRVRDGGEEVENRINPEAHIHEPEGYHRREVEVIRIITIASLEGQCKRYLGRGSKEGS